jgi:hypothetical protein
MLKVSSWGAGGEGDEPETAAALRVEPVEFGTSLN